MVDTRKTEKSNNYGKIVSKPDSGSSYHMVKEKSVILSMKAMRSPIVTKYFGKVHGIIYLSGKFC